MGTSKANSIAFELELSEKAERQTELRLLRRNLESAVRANRELANVLEIVLGLVAPEHLSRPAVLRARRILGLE